MTKILLEQLDAEVGVIVAKLWPESKVEVVFSPVLDLELGDVGSDVAIHLAENLRVKPDDIAAQICKEWNVPRGCSAEVLNGFINVRFAECDSDLFDEDPYTRFSRDSLAIVVAPFSKTTSRLAEFRLCCAGLAQLLIASHAGIDARLILGSEAFLIKDGIPTLMRRILNKLIGFPVHAVGEAFSSSAALELCKDSSNIALWIAPHALPRDTFVSLCRALSEGGKRLHVLGPAAPWLDFRFHTEKLEDFLLWNDEQLLSLLWYFSEGNVAADMDFSIARTAERANISWFWESTRERAARLLGAGKPDPQSAGSAEVTPILRRLGLRVSYLRTFYVQAAVSGKLQNFMAALSDTLITFNRIFNDPGFRIRHAEGNLSCVETKIIAGALKSLSDSITLCDFSEGKSYGSHARPPHQTQRTIVSDYE